LLENAPADFVEHSRELAVQWTEYKRAEILTPTSNPELTATWRQELLSIGVTDAEITDGSEIYGYTYCWLERNGADCGNYMAHVDTSLQGQLHFVVERSTNESPTTLEHTATSRRSS